MTDSRYSRQIRFEPLGPGGQQLLGSACAVIVGCGALGTVHASLLVRAGVGTVRIIDRDYVEESNLQRQLLFTESDAREALPKAEAARRSLLAVNSSVTVEARVSDLHSGNAEELLAGDVILDGTDNFETRMLINDFAVMRGIPWIYGAAVGSYGIAMPVLPGDSACFRCVYPEVPTGPQPTCETSGVLGPLTSIIASIQAMEALKILCGRSHAVRRKIFTADVWNGPVREISMPERDPECPTCGRREFSSLNARRAPVSLCGRNAVQIHERARPVDLAALAVRLEGLGVVRYNEFALRMICEAHEITVFPDGRAIIKGTTEPAVARAIYSRYLGN